MRTDRRARITRALEGFYAFLDRPLFLWSRAALVVLVVPLLVAAVTPLWRIEMEAPQYPDGLVVDVYAHKIDSGHDGADLREINILNHYIGMKHIDRAALADLDWLPFGFGVLAIMLLRLAAIGNVRSLVDYTVGVGYFGLFCMGRFAYRMYVYGHELSPDAPVKIAPFMPAMLGTKQVGNFTTHASPQLGAYLFALFIAGVAALAVAHLAVGRRRHARAELGAVPATAGAS